MTRKYFAQELEGVATFWRLFRKDGVALAFTSHDRDLWFDGMLHRAAPGMLPSALRRTDGLEPDAAEVEGALSHDSIAPEDLAAGRFDETAIQIGAVDWETLENAVLFSGTLGEIAEEDAGFQAELRSAKAALAIDPVPRTSPTCRAEFCGPGCTLPAIRFTHETAAVRVDHTVNAVAFDCPHPDRLRDGRLRWIDGPMVGTAERVIGIEGDLLILERPLHAGIVPGLRAAIVEGCDHTIATCADRFANGVNFQGEPFLPGNDLLTRYPAP